MQLLEKTRQKVLLLVPASYRDQRHYFLGSTKDIAGRLEYFGQRGIECETVEHGKLAPSIIATLGQLPLTEYAVIILEKANFPSVIKYLKRNAPHAKLWYRAHNAEILHRVDYLRCTLKRREFSSLPDQIRTLFHFALRDWFTARNCDQILAISADESEHYWGRLAGRDRVVNLPFFLPDQYLVSASSAPKRQLAVCFTSMEPGIITADAVEQFLSVLHQVADHVGDWQFVISGKLHPVQLEQVRAMAPLVTNQLFASPTHALAPAGATILLSDLGRGFKTKLLEAAAAGNFLLCHHRLYSRLPEELQRQGAPVHPKKPKTFLEGLRLAKEFQSESCADVNASLKQKAFAALDRQMEKLP